MPITSGPASRPAAIALCLLLACAAIAALCAGAQAAQYKMVACAASSGAPPFATETNTVTSSHPNGIFDFNNWCGGAGGDPPGDAAFMRISEHEPSGNAGQGAFGRFVFATPGYVHFLRGGGYTREPNAFNAGWLARFRVTDFANNTTTSLNQGSGLPNSGVDWATTGSFAPHLWPFGSYIDFHHFYFELMCNLPGGCDRANYNAVDANGFVFILSDDSPSEVSFFNTDSPLMQGRWVRGTQGVFWISADKGSGIRFERVRIDGAERHVIDLQALGQCNATATQTNGEFSRVYQPCPTGGPWGREFDFDTAGLPDGAHTVSVCTQDYGQYQGLNGTGSESCVARTIHVDNHAPGAPAGLQVTSANPNRYLSHLGAQFSLPPDPGSPIAKVHYQVTDAAGEPLTPEATFAATNPSEVPEVIAPGKAGSYQLKVWLEDSVGLAGPATLAPIPHDTTPPAAPQELSVTPPDTSRAKDGFDVRWHDIADSGSPIDAAHYEVLDPAGRALIRAQTVRAEKPEAISELLAPSGRGAATLRVWLSDAEGNFGAPASVPLAYRCPRSQAGAATALSLGLGASAQSAAIVRQGEGPSLSGAVRGAGGPLEGAALCVFARVLTDPEPQFAGMALSGADGSYSFALGAGPSREYEVRYRADQRELSATATSYTRVRPTFKLARRVVRNGGYAHFSGRIPGPHNDRVVVVLQVRSGKGWRVFRRYRTRGDGHYSVRYRFTRTTTPTTYVMRAQVRSQAGYPYLQGNSRALALKVRP